MRMAVPLTAAMLLSPLAWAQTQSPQPPAPAQMTPVQTPAPATPAPESPAAATPLTQSFSTDQRHEIEAIIKDYLVKHP
ncbi:MAG TPA: hypothetical protein VJX48_07620, partial [Xanthobacteraceae bacterium]|nr:hypothetical protein [Xanthobacteraceae bacterium]